MDPEILTTHPISPCLWQENKDIKKKKNTGWVGSMDSQPEDLKQASKSSAIFSAAKLLMT